MRNELAKVTFISSDFSLELVISFVKYNHEECGGAEERKSTFGAIGRKNWSLRRILHQQDKTGTSQPCPSAHDCTD